MPTSFDSMYEETRRLALLDEPPPAQRRTGVSQFVVALALLLPALIVVLL